MNWSKVRYGIWIIGFLFLAGSAISFVHDVSQDANGKSSPEQWVIGLFSALGASLVLAFWGWKWYKLQKFVQTPGAFPVKIVALSALGLIGFILIIICFVTVLTSLAKSAPEYLESQNFIKGNPAVTTRYGSLTEMELDNTGWEFQESGNVRSGQYQFKVKGASKDGVIRIKWHTKDGKFTPTEIDEIASPDLEAAIWSEPAN